ncbi:type II toxin-antitoxin system RelE/ParE family toxin [Bradyrhizobium sp. STM 3557]|uniref:type II toxin-antitoxin system RelE/ParE family toxin n=1 Tax=Bradyrhizobium sp. STM 3557 TaxID=578920 RepID=UPI00388D14EC
MGEVRLSKLAQDDLVEIWRRIAADNGPANADRWIDRIEARLRQLAVFPESGPARSDIAPAARILVIARWLVLYQTETAGVRIIRIVDASRNLGEIDISDE